MFCRKCGAEIPDDSVFCEKCGETTVKINNSSKSEISDDSMVEICSPVPNTEDNNIKDSNINNNSTLKNLKKINWNLTAIAFAAIIIIVIGVIIANTKCKYAGCSNDKMAGGDYCYIHTCNVSGCFNKKGYSGDYCYDHSCNHILCNNRVVEGGFYCLSHTCSVAGCYNEIEDGRNKCSKHAVSVPSLLDDIRFSFETDKYGCIDFFFNAKNKSGKIIKYVKLDIRFVNAVGDSIKKQSVSITGPISSGEKIEYDNHSLCYCDGAEEVRIYDVEIIYTDGTSDMGALNMWATKMGKYSAAYTMGTFRY